MSLFIKNGTLYIAEAKARNYHKIKDTLAGKNKYIRTWGIITAENPMGINFDSEVNKQRNRELRSYLASFNMEYIKVKGKYGNDENSLFVINPALSDMKKIATIFGQESFIFAVNSYNDEFSFNASYYETSAPTRVKLRFKDPNYTGSDLETFSYNEVISKDRIIDQKSADDFFTSISTHNRKFKFQIPFFESIIIRAHNTVKKLTEGLDQEQIQYDLDRTTIYSEDYTPGSRWRARGILYKTVK